MLPAAEVLRGRGIAGDRRWMLASSDISRLLDGGEKWRPWRYGPTLKTDSRLARLRASLRGAILTVEARGGGAACGDMESAEGRRAVEDFLREFLEDDALVLADCERRPAWDYADTPLTAVFSESIADLSRRAGAPLAAARFRANIVLDGGAAWDEMKCIGGELSLGAEVKLSAAEAVTRCAATRVNPQTAERDMHVPEQLLKFYGHNEMGIKFGVVAGGAIAPGDAAIWR